jgi:hypothetical protein
VPAVNDVCLGALLLVTEIPARTSGQMNEVFLAAAVMFVPVAGVTR